MPKSFKNLINILYIEGFFLGAYINRDYYKAKPLFLLNLLKGSVCKPELIRVSQSSLNGYISGNSINSIAEDLIKAGFDKDLLSGYIKGLYQTNHKDSKTYNDKYGKLNYGEALCQIASNEFEDLTMENMADKLANEIYTIITDAAHNSIIKKSNEFDNKDTPSALRDLITEDEKKAIFVLCKLINISLQSIERQTGKKRNKETEISSLTDSEKDKNWASWLKDDIDRLKKEFSKSYKDLVDQCKDMVDLLKSKKNINSRLNVIVSIAKNIISDKYSIKSIDAFDYNAFSLMKSHFDDAYDNLLRIREKL